MTWFDWAIVVVVGLSTLLSLRRGFVREALSLATWVAAFVIAVMLGDRLSGQLTDLIGHDVLRYITAYVLLFVATLVIGSMLSKLMAQLVRITGLGGADRALGTAFGAVRGLLLVLALLFVYRTVTPVEEQEVLRESRFAPYLLTVEQWARQMFADHYADIVVGNNSGGLPRRQAGED